MTVVEMWLVSGFVVAVPLFIYVGALALLSRVLKRERPVLQAVMISSGQEKQCQASKNGKAS